MMLIEARQLALDEPVERLLPELAQRRVLRALDAALDDTVPARRSITVRDIMTFRHGFGIPMARPGSYPIQAAMIPRHIAQGPPRPLELPAPDEWMRGLGELPLMHQPGEGWMYNTGSDILGVLVARAAGQPFERFLEERIFAPLGMKDTAFFVPPAKIDRLVASYAVANEESPLTLYDPARGGQWSRPPAFPSAAGGLVSTVDDYLAFAAMMLAGGKHGPTRLLSADSVRQMTTDQLSAGDKQAAHFVPGLFDHMGWGLGLGVVTEGDELGRSPRTFGWDGGLGASSWIDPARSLAGVLLTQRAWSSPNPPQVCQDFWRAIYA
jgi:CubicO group peptidase (beta-lactamase class C family)